MMSPAFNYFKNEEQYDMLADGYKKLFEYELENIKQGDYEIVLTDNMFMQMLKKMHYSRERTHSCGVGRNMIVIDTNGDIYPCQRFVGENDFLLGNIYNIENLENIKQLNYNTINNECYSCWARNLCNGGCAHQNFKYGKKTNSHDELYCNYYRKICEAIIDVYLSLDHTEIKKILG